MFLKVIRSTGFMKGLYTESEMKSDNVKVCLECRSLIFILRNLCDFHIAGMHIYNIHSRWDKEVTFSSVEMLF